MGGEGLNIKGSIKGVGRGRGFPANRNTAV